jgi:acyl-CoA-binding protein
MCEEDKSSFKDELLATAQAIKKMSSPADLDSRMPGLTEKAGQYNDMYNELSGAGQTDAEDRANNKRNLKAFEGDVADALEVAERNFDKAQALKKLLTQ